jgi:genome maintenance exonuclease 1
MVDLIPIKKRYKYKKLYRQDGEDGRRYRVMMMGEDQLLPSVTTILSATKDMSTLDAWAARVGPEAAEKIRVEAAAVGTSMHLVIDMMFARRMLPRPKNWLTSKGYEMGYMLINTFFGQLQEVWGSEVALYYPEKYAGTTDLVGIYRGKPAIIDFKQSLKPKRHQWISDYFHQLTAYAAAHDIVHGTKIEYGVVLVACQTGETQEFSIAGQEFKDYQNGWMERVARFRALNNPSVS